MACYAARFLAHRPVRRSQCAPWSRPVSKLPDLFGHRCKNAAVHYHEAFWLIVGGAAPVVVLAAIVAATNEMQMAITVNTKLLLSNRYYKRKYTYTGLIYLGCVMVEILVFFAAMYSLATAKDVGAPVQVMWAALVGLFLAFMLPYSAFQLREARRWATQLARAASEQS